MASLQLQYRSLDRKITAAYQEKINGSVEEALWQQMHASLTTEKRKVECELRAVSDDRGDYLKRGVLLIELAQSTDDAYEKASAEVKRKIIEIVSSNHTLRGGSLRFQYGKPFDLTASTDPRVKWWN